MKILAVCHYIVCLDDGFPIVSLLGHEVLSVDRMNIYKDEKMMVQGKRI